MIKNRAYVLNTGEVAAAANQIVFDLFNPANSGEDVLIKAMYIVPKTDVAVTGVVSPKFDVFRTSAIGTSGTTVGYSATTAIRTITPLDSENVPPNGITARIVPTGGATSAAYLISEYPFSEETNAGTFVNAQINALGELAPIVLHQGQGFAVRQGSVASLNSYMFIVVFELETA